MEYLEIGPAPAEENCAQVGADDYPARSRMECRAFARQIARAMGEMPEGVELRVKSFEHDYGTYREVVCHYDSLKPGALAFALRCESEAPSRWDDTARRQLAEAGFPVAP